MGTPSSLKQALSDWAGDPAWLAMDMGERGLHSSLVLGALARGPHGVVPDTSETWEACGVSESMFCAHARLAAAWPVLDDEALRRRPDLAAWRGWRWNGLAERLGGGGPAAEEGFLPDPLPRLALGAARFERLTPQAVGACFKSVGHDERAGLWDMGLSWLAQEAGSRRESRAYLGRLIKEFGEHEVFLAVADAVSRKVDPADAKSWLRGALRRRCEGSPAEQAAREARTRVLM